MTVRTVDVETAVVTGAGRGDAMGAGEASASWAAQAAIGQMSPR